MIERIKQEVLNEISMVNPIEKVMVSQAIDLAIRKCQGSFDVERERYNEIIDILMNQGGDDKLSDMIANNEKARQLIKEVVIKQERKNIFKRVDDTLESSMNNEEMWEKYDELKKEMLE